MGLFDTVPCDACGKKVGALSRVELPKTDVTICMPCLKSFMVAGRSPDEARAAIKAHVAQRRTGASEPTPAATAQPAPPTELNALQKLQFRKFVSEQGGMSLQEADNYLAGAPDSDRNEIIAAFHAAASAASATPAISSPPPQVASSEAQQPQCPKCGSQQTTHSNQRFGVGKAAAGVLLTGGIGLLAGGIGRNKILLTCLKCGHQWTVG